MNDEQVRIGTLIAGRYQLVDVVGIGSMGAVYRADDQRDGGAVAIKILRSHLGDSDEAIARFQREAFVGVRVGHPNCVRIHDFGTCDDGAIFLVMELLDGESLTDLLGREGRLPWRRALHILQHVLRGLGHAHAQGIAHRDIKPDNIAIQRRDDDADFARVLDFGIAKLVAGGAGPAITQAGLTVGTPHYLSPEQAAGGAELDGRSDLYSLSVVLFELLTGQLPFDGADLVQILTAHASAPVPRFAEVAPDVEVPAAVEALVRDGLAKRPADRIASAAAYLARVDQLLAGVGAGDSVADPEIGTLLDGRYQLSRMIGRGGMGRVYQAMHVGLDRQVAIKVLDPRQVADDDARRRFDREAQSTGRLRHPNCVGVTDSGTMPDGSPYLVMELIDGRSLDDVLADETRLPLGRALHVLRHVLRGLAHAHAQGLVHRDLKPANIMIVSEAGDRDFAKILDFGLARVITGAEDRITRTGVVCGTPRYMSPEQVQDRPVDARADLYAASVIAFELLTGVTPFDAEESLGLLQMHLATEVPRFAEVAPELRVPAAIEELIRRGLAKRADDRPRSAEEYLGELDRACAAAARTATPDQTIELARLDSLLVSSAMPPPIPARRRRRRLAIGGAVAAILGVGILAAIVGGGSSTAAAPATALAKVAADPEPEIEMEAESAPGVDPAITAALTMARRGRGEEAVTQLRELRQRRPDDPQISYALGRVYDRLGWPKPTLDAYRAALRLDPALAEDAALIGDVVALLASKSTWQLAAKVVEQEIGGAALPALTEAAAHHKDATVRGRAAKIRDRLAAADQPS